MGKSHALLYVNVGRGANSVTLILDARRDPEIRNQLARSDSTPATPMFRIRLLKNRPHMDIESTCLSCCCCFTNGWVKPIRENITIRYNVYSGINKIKISSSAWKVGSLPCEGTNFCSCIVKGCCKLICFPLFATCKCIHKTGDDRPPVTCYNVVNFMIYYLQGAKGCCGDPFMASTNKEGKQLFGEAKDTFLQDQEVIPEITDEQRAIYSAM